MSAPTQAVDVLRIGPAGREARTDVAVVEAPLEVRLDGEPFVMTMRTPGADADLAAGLLLSERIITADSDIIGIDREDGAEGTRPAYVDVRLNQAARERARDALAARRVVTTTSACGVCGRKSIDDLTGGLTPNDSVFAVRHDVIVGLPQRLRSVQGVFDATGGLHAAGLFDSAGRLLASAEDVGRHNAVDKVIGAQLRAGTIPLRDRVLFVSGRTSFEIVQKAAAAGVPMVAAVSAPSSLAIDLAREARITLIGFVRGDGFNVYTVPGRILP